MADPFEDFIEKTGGGGEFPPDMELPTAAPAPGEPAPAVRGGDPDIAGLLANLAGIVFPVNGKIITRAVGSKI